MNLIKKLLGPHSKYDKTLPYTYMAKAPSVLGLDEFFSYYFADTICGLIEYLDNHDIGPDDVELFALYQKNEILLEKELCLNAEGHWLDRPEICRSLETHFKETLDNRYKGHTEQDQCSFTDRERKGRGIGVD